MKIAVHILGYNVSRYIGAALRNSAPFVDKIYVAYPERPFAYIPSSRDKTNPTSVETILSAGLGEKVEIVRGDWLDEESMRNSCFERAKEEGFDWLLTQDADEFYEERVWEQIRRILLGAAQLEHFNTTWYNFWKTSQYVLVHPSGEIKHTNAGFAIRCRKELRFTDRRLTNATQSKVMDCPCHHFGYVMSDEEMLEKLVTWSHAQEVNAQRWYQLKWLNWRESSRYLHPTSPLVWNRAIRFPDAQPDFSFDFALPIEEVKTVSARDQLDELVGDQRAIWTARIRDMKRRVRLATPHFR